MISLKFAPAQHNRTFYGLLAGNVIVLALLGFFAIRPVAGLLVKHTTEIGQVRGEVSSIQKKTDELRKLKGSIDTYEQTYAPLLDGLPKTKNVAAFQTELDELAKLTGSQLLTFDAAPKTSGTTTATSVGGFQAVPANVTLGGTYASVQDFIRRVETMNRFTRVASLDLKASPDTGALRATIQLQTLYQP